MAYTVAIVLRCREGEGETFARILAETAGPSLEEPACRQWQAHRSPDDPALFFIYEQYADEAGYQAHLRTPAFARVQRELFPLVADRQVQVFETIAP